MNKKRPEPLSLDGSYEQIVNARTAAHRKQKQKWFTKTARVIVVLLGLLLVNITLWLFEVIPSVPSVYISEILTCVISFLAGRIYEVVKR